MPFNFLETGKKKWKIDGEKVWSQYESMKLYWVSKNDALKVKFQKQKWQQLANGLI